jgi:hypothetical protein
LFFRSILLARGFPLELVTQNELHDAVRVGARIGKVGVVQGVVGFGAELDGVVVSNAA